MLTLGDAQLKVSRRSFLEQIGACLAGGAALSQFGDNANGESGARLSLKNQVAWTPPPNLTNPNVLFIMVDQMRYPLWLSPSQQTVFEQQIIPNIMGLIGNKSYAFDQYYTCATVCSAARGTLLSGLYAPQSGTYTQTRQKNLLLPAFSTWGQGIQALNAAYKNNVWWFGKWHLSTCTTTTPLQPYGFQTGNYPGGPQKNPDPQGVGN
jgi:arylsulfatase A-like enzyme